VSRSWRPAMCALGVLAGLVLPGVAKAAPTELFFSEYIEGSSNNKALEIYNGTGAAVNLGTQGYNVQMFFNGSSAAGLTINLAGTVAHNDVFVVAQSLASATILAQADQTNGAGWFNGDDAVVLRKGTTVIDFIGQIGFDPGTEWGTGLTSTADNTLRRKQTITAGDTNGADAFDPSVEWDGFATDTFGGLGSHSINTGGDTAPTVTDSDPDNGDLDVPLDSDVSVTFSEPVTTTSAAFTIACSASGTHTFALTTTPTSATLNPDVDFAQGETCTVTVDDSGVADVDADDPPDTMSAVYTFSFSTVAATRRIYEIQGAGHISPFNGQLVSAVPGVVVAKRPNSLYVQDAVGDGNPATSDAILVFRTGLGALFNVGDAVLISGRVTEFRPGGASSANLSTTEIENPVVTYAGPGATIAPTVVGQGGRVPPNVVIEDDATGDVETSGTFDPATDGIDFYESLEAMLLQVNDPVVVGPRNGFGEVWVLADDGANAFLRTTRGGILVRKLGLAPYPNDYAAGDFNPERIQLDDEIIPGQMPAVNVGDEFTGSVAGVLDYNFGNFEILLTAAPTRIDNGLVREVTTEPKKHDLTVATFNVENLRPSDPPSKFAELAELIVDHLRAPAIVALEEIQDNNGAVNDATTDATVTYQTLIAAIQAAGGPPYAFRQIDPVDDQDGGEPGGNIRVGFIFRTDIPDLEFVDRPGATPTTANSVVDTKKGAQLRYSPGRIDPTNPAFTASRKPLAVEFRYRKQTVFLIANHFSSKGGDQPLFGRFQPPLRSSEAQRHQQAQVVNDFVDQILAADRKADVVVLGDLNDFDFSATLELLEGGVLTTLIETLPPSERYTYVFEGNSQSLDHILVSQDLAKFRPVYDVVHVNAEFAQQASDHDPQVARLEVHGTDSP
jgi:predicted extracellular nuclease